VEVSFESVFNEIDGTIKPRFIERVDRTLLSPNTDGDETMTSNTTE